MYLLTSGSLDTLHSNGTAKAKVSSKGDEVDDI